MNKKQKKDSKLNCSRPVLMDKCELVLSPLYYSDDETRLSIIDDCFELLTPYFQYDVQKSTKIKMGHYPNRKRYVSFDNFLIKEFNEFINFFSHVRMSVDYPYSVTAEFNFIRYLRWYVDRNSYFDHKYDDYVRIRDDNFINYHNWPVFDITLVNDLSADLPILFRNFAHDIWSILFPDHEFILYHTSIPKVEFNHEYFVGHGNSLNVMRKILTFMFTDKGRSFKKNLGSIGVNVYKASGNFNDVQNVIDTDQGQTVKFYMGDGIWFKIYRKTKDHVRAEVGFESSFIRRKCKTAKGSSTRKYSIVYGLMRNLAKETLRRANIPALISYIDTPASTDSYASVRSAEFLDGIYQGLASVTSAIASNSAISDPDGRRFIRNVSGVRHSFCPVRKKDGSISYLYDPNFVLRHDELNKDLPAPAPNEFLEHYKRMHKRSMGKTFGDDVYPIGLYTKDKRDLVKPSVKRSRLVSDKKEYSFLVGSHDS